MKTGDPKEGEDAPREKVEKHEHARGERFPGSAFFPCKRQPAWTKSSALCNDVVSRLLARGGSMNIVQTNGKLAAVEQGVSSYKEKLETHPIRRLCEAAKLPPEILRAFARVQFVDSIMWVPMLSLIKGQISSSALREAVRKNIRDEVGDEGTPHVTLCKRFLESIGVPTQFNNYVSYSPASLYPVSVMMGLAGNCDDAMIGGWLLAQEVLVPVLFRMFRPAFRVFSAPNLAYMTEHEEVDSVDHSRWILEALDSILASADSAGPAIAGVDLGGRATLGVPDFLFAEVTRLQRLV